MAVKESAVSASFRATEFAAEKTVQRSFISIRSCRFDAARKNQKIMHRHTFHCGHDTNNMILDKTAAGLIV